LLQFISFSDIFAQVDAFNNLKSFFVKNCFRFWKQFQKIISFTMCRVRPMARLLKKASEELQVGDEAVVAFRGKRHLRYLAMVEARQGEGDATRYGVRFADGDVEEGVPRTQASSGQRREGEGEGAGRGREGMCEFKSRGDAVKGKEEGRGLEKKIVFAFVHFVLVSVLLCFPCPTLTLAQP
jgi:hypothetical protein